jgi:hypothetical protein
MQGTESRTTLRKGNRQLHPHTDQLERFMRTELSMQEAAQIVRHLMKGCAQCQAVTRRFWTFGAAREKEL